MAYRLFSQREAERQGKKPVPSTKSFLPSLRRQIIVTLSEAIGTFYDGPLGIGHDEVLTTESWKQFDRILYKRCDAYANYQFKRHETLDDRVRTFMGNCSDKDFLDALDLAVAIINIMSRDVARRGTDYMRYVRMELSPNQGLAEIDMWLREGGSVYRVVEGQVVETSDDFTHDEVVVPALQRLREAGFENAAREFDEALQAYRQGRFADVLTKANHAFESAMKVIAGKMGWAYKETGTANHLISVMIDNGLVPAMRQSAITALRALLESDVPTLRNKMPSAGHGAGEVQDAEVPEYMAAFALQSVAANINLLIDAYRAKRKAKRQGK